MTAGCARRTPSSWSSVKSQKIAGYPLRSVAQRYARIAQMSGPYKVAWLCEALLVSRERLLRLGRAAPQTWTTANGEHPVARAHPRSVCPQSSDPREPTARSCARLLRTAQPHGSPDAQGATLRSAALQVSPGAHRQPPWRADLRPTACKTSPSNGRIKSGSRMPPACSPARAGCTSSRSWMSSAGGWLAGP